MVDYGLTKWAHENDEIPEVDAFRLPEEGQRTLFIKNATFDNDTQKYEITFVDIDDGVEFRQFYGLLKAGPNGTPTKNGLSYKTVNSLTEALFHGAGIKLANADNMIGGIVIGVVKHNPDKKDPSKIYANVNEYMPAPREDVESYSQIKQYYAGMDI